MAKQSITGKEWGKLTLRTKGSPEQCGSVGWALFCTAKGPQFDSQSGHMPGLRVRSPVRAYSDWRFSLTSMFLLLSPSFVLSLKINKIFKNKKCQNGDGGGTGWKMVKKLTKEHLCMTQRYRQNKGNLKYTKLLQPWLSDLTLCLLLSCFSWNRKTPHFVLFCFLTFSSQMNYEPIFYISKDDSKP